MHALYTIAIDLVCISRPCIACQQEMREREINNGRFAMFAAIGIIAAELYTGKDAIEQFGL